MMHNVALPVLFNVIVTSQTILNNANSVWVDSHGEKIPNNDSWDANFKCHFIIMPSFYSSGIFISDISTLSLHISNLGDSDFNLWSFICYQHWRIINVNVTFRPLEMFFSWESSSKRTSAWSYWWDGEVWGRRPNCLLTSRRLCMGLIKKQSHWTGTD